MNNTGFHAGCPAEDAPTMGTGDVEADDGKESAPCANPKTGGAMISTDYQMVLAQADLAKLRGTLVGLEELLAKLPRIISTQVKPHRTVEILQRIRELEAELRAYERAHPDGRTTAHP